MTYKVQFEDAQAIAQNIQENLQYDGEDDERWTETERAAFNGLGSIDYHFPD